MDLRIRPPWSDKGENWARLIAWYFCPKPAGLTWARYNEWDAASRRYTYQVNHVNRNSRYTVIENLEIVFHKKNAEHYRAAPCKHVHGHGVIKRNKTKTRVAGQNQR